MQNLGFLSKEFSLLPNDASSGSRELLLAFAWLLCKQNLVDKFMDNCSSPIEDSSLLNEVQYCFISKNKVRLQYLKKAYGYCLKLNLCSITLKNLMNSTNWRCLIIYSYCILCSMNKTFFSKWNEHIVMRNRQMLQSLGIFLNFNNTSSCTCLYLQTYMHFLSAIYHLYSLNCQCGRNVHMIFHGKYNIFFTIKKAESNNTTQEVRSLALSASLSPVQKVQQLQLLNGKLRSSLRRLYALQREKAKLQHRVGFL